jgi:aspartyl-tRNA(Asn)/glutamyl-tRNA(Gln) amidotransferase subunit A
VALTEACLDRARTWHASRNCFIRIDSDAALETARERDRELKRGQRRGALHGCAIGSQGHVLPRGKVSTGGSRILQGQIATTTATVLQRLDAAGAIEIGVLNMSEFAAGPTGHNIPLRRLPQCFQCGAYTGRLFKRLRGRGRGARGLRRARLRHRRLDQIAGRLQRGRRAQADLRPREPPRAMPRSWSFDHVGPLGRTARDCALLLQIIAGHDPNDATTSARPVPDYPGELGADRLSGLTIGIADHGVAIDPEIAAAMDDSVRVLQAIGAKVVRVVMPDLTPLFRIGETIIKGESCGPAPQWLESRPQDYSNGVRFASKAGFFVSAADYIDALRLRGVMTEKFLAETMDGIDLLHLPASAHFPPTIEESDMESSSSEALPRPLRQAHPVHAAIQFFRPAGDQRAVRLLVGRLPLAYQLVGHPFTKRRCCMRSTSISARPTIIVLCRRCDLSVVPAKAETQSKKKKKELIPLRLELTLRLTPRHEARLQARAVIEDLARPGEPDLRALRVIDDMFQRAA